MDGFKQRLLDAISDSSYGGNLRKLSMEAGRGDKYLQNIVGSHTNVDRSTQGPGIFGITDVCDKIGLSLDALMNRSQFSDPLQNPHRVAKLLDLLTVEPRNPSGSVMPDPKQIYSIYKNSGGRTEGFAAIAKFADAYDPISSQDDRLVVQQMGPQSLAAYCLDIASTKVLQTSLDGIDGTEDSRAAKRRHILARGMGCFSSHAQLKKQVPDKALFVDVAYVATYVATADAGGKETTLLFASMIS